LQGELKREGKKAEEGGRKTGKGKANSSIRDTGGIPRNDNLFFPVFLRPFSAFFPSRFS
jgi:hypothetical protein